MTLMTRTYPPATPIWCAGCGHFAVLNALRAAIDELAIPLHEVAVLAGIGCSGTIQNYIGGYGYHALHGRVLPTAAGVALSDPSLTVVAAGGDGDGYAIGAGHLLHAFRRNVPFAYICMNNETYGLTKGQDSPSAFLTHASTTFDGTLAGLAIPSSTFIARGYSGRYDQLRRLTRATLEHARAGRGFAFLEVVSPCVTYADTYPDWEATVVDVDADPDYDAQDRARAFATAVGLADQHKLPIGLLYRSGDAAPGGRGDRAPATLDLTAPDLRLRYEDLVHSFLVGRIDD